MKWRPSRAQKRAFAEKMKNEEFARAYNERKMSRDEKKRGGSAFDYETAGGWYFVTEMQSHAAAEFLRNRNDLFPAEKAACEFVLMAYSCREKCHHDHIHIVNELKRNEESF